MVTAILVVKFYFHLVMDPLVLIYFSMCLYRM